MSAKDEIKDLYNELMGLKHVDKNTKKKIKFYSHKICKPFLLESCPYDYLWDVKANMDECKGIHSLLAKEEYTSHPKRDKFKYEKDALDSLEEIINRADLYYETNCDKLRIARKEIDDNLLKMKQKVSDMDEEIRSKVKLAENLGEMGNVYESQKMMDLVIEMKNSRQLKEDEYCAAVSYKATPLNRYNVSICEICGGFMNTVDNNTRKQEHVHGKFHLAHVTLREKYSEIKNRLDEVMNRLHAREMKKLKSNKRKRAKRESKTMSSSDSSNDEAKLYRRKRKEKRRKRRYSKSSSRSRSKSCSDSKSS